MSILALLASWNPSAPPPPPPTPSPVAAWGPSVEAYLGNTANYNVITEVQSNTGTSIMDALATMSSQLRGPHYDRHPDDRGLLILTHASKEYVQRIDRSFTRDANIDIISPNLDPMEVTLRAPATAGANEDGDTYEAAATGGILAGIHFVNGNTLVGARTNAAVHNGEGGDSQKEYVFWRCGFSAVSTASLSWGITTGSSLFIGDSENFNGIYSHNFGPGGIGHPARMIYDNVIMHGGGLYEELGSGNDDLWVMTGGDLVDGYLSFTYQNNGNASNTSTTAWVDPAAATAGAVAGFDLRLEKNLAPPAPLAANDLFQNFWFPNLRGTVEAVPVTTGAVTKQSLVAGRTYYIPIDIAAAHHLMSVTNYFGTVEGNITMDFLYTSGTHPLGSVALISPSVATAAATTTQSLTVATPRSVIPGIGYFLSIKLSSGTATIDTSNVIPVGTRYSDTGDPASSTLLTSGPVPASILNLA